MEPQYQNASSQKWVRYAIFIVIIVCVGVLLLNWRLVNPVAVQSWVESFGPFGPIVFILLFAVAAVLFVPATVMVLAGGAMFGPFFGSVYNVLGATLGALLAFLISRYLAREWAQRRSGPRLGFIIKGVQEEGWRFVLLVRLAGVPYFVLNYALGLTAMRMLSYGLASAAGLAPSTIAMTYAGYVGFEAFRGEEGMIGKILTAIALIAASALIPIVLRMFKKARNAGA